MHATASASDTANVIYTVDVAKNVFQVHTFSARGVRMKQHRLSRAKFMEFFANAHRARGVVVMEACASAHFWGRWLTERDYQAKLLPAQFVAQHRVGNKTDRNDADAIYATHQDRRVKPVPVKSLEQQDAGSWHCLRDLLIGQRTALINQARGLLAERGCIGAKGQGGFNQLMARIHEREEAQVTRPLLQVLEQIGQHLELIDKQLATIEGELENQLAQSPVAQRLKTIFGVGTITATAVAADTGGNVDRFSDSRQYAASLGITAKEDSSGDRRRQGAITKRGNAYLRRLLVQCAQSVITYCRRREDALCLLARRLLDQGKKRNVVVIAVANRLARILYAVIKHRQPYCPQGMHVTHSAIPVSPHEQGIAMLA
jgi:transposase